YAAVRFRAWIEGVVGKDVHRTVAPIPERLRVQSGLVKGPDVLLGSALGAINEQHVMTERVLERTVPQRAFERGRRLGPCTPLAVLVLQPKPGVIRPRDAVQGLAVQFDFQGLARLHVVQAEGKARNILSRTDKPPLAGVPAHVRNALLECMDLL